MLKNNFLYNKCMEEVRKLQQVCAFKSTFEEKLFDVCVNDIKKSLLQSNTILSSNSIIIEFCLASKQFKQKGTYLTILKYLSKFNTISKPVTQELVSKLLNKTYSKLLKKRNEVSYHTTEIEILQNYLEVLEQYKKINQKNIDRIISNINIKDLMKNHSLTYTKLVSLLSIIHISSKTQEQKDKIDKIFLKLLKEVKHPVLKEEKEDVKRIRKVKDIYINSSIEKLLQYTSTDLKESIEVFLSEFRKF